MTDYFFLVIKDMFKSLSLSLSLSLSEWMLGVGACVIDTCGRAFAIFFKLIIISWLFLVYFSIYFFYFSFTPFIFFEHSFSK